MPSRLGILSDLYFNDGTYAAPDFQAIKLVGDLNVNGGWNEGEATTRLSRIVEMDTTTYGLEITGNIRVKLGNDGYNALRDAHINDTPIDVLALNGKIDQNGTEGYRFWGKVFTWTEDQSRGVVVFKQFNIKPVPPEDEDEIAKYVKIEGGVPVYTDIGDQTGSA